MKRILKPMACAAALALALPAHAAGLTGDAPGFNRLDENNDASLSRAEAAGNPSLVASFNKVDDDGNGELSRMEYLEHMTKKDFRALREKTADFIEPGDDNAASGGSK